MKTPSVYIMANPGNTTLYIGVTSDLETRVAQHKSGLFDNSFSKRYNTTKLVYCEEAPSMDEAIAREKGVRRQGNSHALYGRIFCKSCGQPYMRRGFRRKAAPSEQYYVWCCRGRVSGSECRNPNIREDVLMKLVSAEGSYMVESSGAVVEKNHSAVHNKSF